MTSSDSSARTPHADAPRDLAQLKRRALYLVQNRYEAAARLQNLTLEQLNRDRGAGERHASVAELIRWELARAEAVATFAVTLGLITPDQARQAIADNDAAHPGLRELLKREPNNPTNIGDEPTG